MEPRSGRGKAYIWWSRGDRRWIAFHKGRAYRFIKWENALYFANSAVTTDRRTREGMKDHDAD